MSPQPQPQLPIPHVYYTNSLQASYVELLQKLLPRVIKIEADEEMPDCCFVEDMAVVVGDVAVVASPGAASRRGEVGPVRWASLGSIFIGFVSVVLCAVLLLLLLGSRHCC